MIDQVSGESWSVVWGNSLLIQAAIESTVADKEAAVSHISQKTSEMWGTRGLLRFSQSGIGNRLPGNHIVLARATSWSRVVPQPW
jgi:hypothetical protein